jgi:hypothetical protein
MIDASEIEKEVRLSIQAKINSLVKDDQVLTLVSRIIDSIVSERVTSIINSQLNNLLQKGKLEKELDLKYDDKIKTVIEQEVRSKAAHAVAKIDLATEIGKQLEQTINNKLKAIALPEKAIKHSSINWDGFELSANALAEGTIQNFNSTGIQDAATQVELTVVDGSVIVENSLVARNVVIKEKVVAEELVVGDLKINRQLIMNESINKQFVSLIKDNITTELSKRKIDIAASPIYLNDKEVLNENTLGSNIINSNLRKLGRLTELNVGGIAQFNDTLLVTDVGKIGINTSEPEGVLTLWDDDSELTIKRYKKKNMYIGTMRDTDLSIGTNGNVNLLLRKDGTVEMNNIQLNGLKISVSNKIPTGVGTPGELVIMDNAGENEPWAYRCLGNDRWKAIK